MANKKSDTSVTELFIQFLERGFYLLDNQSRKELNEFINSKQHKSGGFIDRGGKPDLYYSLFGTWLLKAIGLEQNLKKVNAFISEIEEVKLNTPELYSKLLIESIVSEKSKKPSIYFLLKILFRKKDKTNFAYRIFLFLITFDNFYKRTAFIKMMIRLILAVYKPDKDSPISLIAASLVAKNFAGLKTEAANSQLLDYFSEEAGFKMYCQNSAPDLLSTAVALFAIKISTHDVRLVAPACLNLVQQNYDNGAFLSGDGDQTRDLEYTFYGLLVLGILA